MSEGREALTATPDYDSVVAKLGDPFESLGELAAGLAERPPRITPVSDVDIEEASTVGY